MLDPVKCRGINTVCSGRPDLKEGQVGIIIRQCLVKPEGDVSDVPEPEEKARYGQEDEYFQVRVLDKL